MEQETIKTILDRHLKVLVQLKENDKKNEKLSNYEKGWSDGYMRAVQNILNDYTLSENKIV